ncbi:hypothetical protein HDU87_005081 [Geranomyces variabilis]|uniref:START domain-containing protein n=1 Tax=Geranomyces variabilis TaxID=109894 RepID=A0AAD5XQD6_9FUNG|nr:hypothetical protein HDU87_005081 [Geranomyces variabilis]
MAHNHPYYNDSPAAAYHAPPPPDPSHRFSSSTAASDYYMQHQQQHHHQQQQHQQPASPTSSSGGTTLAQGPLQLTPHPDEHPASSYFSGHMSAAAAPISPQNQLLIDAAEAALRSLSDVAAEQENWKPVLTHRTGAVVYRTNKVPKGQIAVFKGVAVIHGFTPDAIFPLIKNRQLWDNWYLDGHVVDHVNENISLSYMVMKPQTALSAAVATTRDLALVDRTAFSPSTGTIAYASTSVDTAKIPKHPGRVRALLKLNGWVLEPQIAADGRSLGTKISYYIQTDVGGMLPGSVVKRYLARRALVVVGVEDYLRKHGAPPPSGEADSAFLKRATMLINPNDESFMHYGSDRSSSFNGSKRGTLMSDAVIHDPQDFRRGSVDPRRPSLSEQFAPNYQQPAHEYSSQYALQHQQPPQQFQQPPPLHQQPPFAAQGQLPAMEDNLAHAETESLSDMVTIDEVSDDENSRSSVARSSVAPRSPSPPTTDIPASEDADRASMAPTSPASPVVAEKVEVVKEEEPASTNPHHDSAALSLRLLRGLESKESGWAFHSESSGVTISQKLVTGAPMPMVRGDAILRGPHGATAQQILSVVKSSSARKVWDGRFEDGNALVNYNLDESLVMSQQKGTFPVSGRDFVTANMTHYDEDGTIYFTATSVVDRSAPVDTKRVRAHLTVAGWIIKPVPEGVAVTYIVQVDIKGSVPSSIIKVIQTQTPLCIAEVFKFLRQKHYVPFVIRNIPGVDPGRSLPLRSEQFDQKDGSYAIEYKRTGTRGRAVVLALPRPAYGPGAQVTVTPRDAVVVTRDREEMFEKVDGVASRADSVLLEVTVADSASGDVDVALSVKPAKSGWTINGRLLEQFVAEPKVIVPAVAAAAAAPPSAVPASVKAVVTPVTPEAAPAAEPVKSAPVARAATASAPAKTERHAPMVRAATTIAAAPAAPAPAGPLPVVPRPTYVPHRHTESGVKALKYLKTLTTSDAWKHHSDQQGVSISTIDEPSSTMPIVRGDATFPAEFSVDDVISVIRCNGARKIWDARFEDGETVEWLNPNELVFKSQQKGQFPVSGRDFAGLQVTIFDARSATTYVVATSVVDALAPVDPKRVRAELTVAGWIVKPAPEGGVAVTYVVKVDPRGSIPGAIVKAVSIQTPLCVAEVLKYLRANGAPPAVKVLGNTGEGIKVVVTRDAFDPRSATYEIGYGIMADKDVLGNGLTATMTKTAGLVEVTMDPRTYPAGADVHISVAADLIAVKSTPDRRFLRLYVDASKLLTTADWKAVVDVKMTKRKGQGPMVFTANGAPVAADDSAALMVAVKKVVQPTSNGVPVQHAPAAVAQAATARSVAAAVVPTPAAAAVHHQPQVVKRRAPSMSAPTAPLPPLPASAAVSPMTTTVAPISSSSHIVKADSDAAPASPAVTYLLAMLSMLLRLLRPILAPNEPAQLPSATDPLDIRAALHGAEPARVVIAAVVGAALSLLIVRWTLATLARAVSAVFGIFSLGQWGVVALAALLAAAYAKEKMDAGKKKDE